MGQSKNTDIQKINERLVDISRAANRLLGDNKSKANIKKLRAFCKALNEDVGDMLKAMPKLCDSGVLSYLKSKSQLTECGTRITVLTQSSIRNHFKDYEQDVRPMIYRLIDSGKIFKSMYSYEVKNGRSIIVNQSSAYCFRECDMKRSYKIGETIYSKVK